MGFLDFLKGGGKKCAYCKKEAESLPYSKIIGGAEKHFCSRECSRGCRIESRKKDKGPPASGRSMPW
jgi:hypothetical protein